MLVKGTPELIARGSGYLAAAGALVLCYIVNGAKLFRGMSAIIPDQEVISDLQDNFQKIQPEEEKKS
jgi:hypothetical protein